MTQKEIDELATLYNKTKKEEYKIKWYAAVKKRYLFLQNLGACNKT